MSLHKRLWVLARRSRARSVGSADGLVVWRSTGGAWAWPSARTLASHSTPSTSTCTWRAWCTVRRNYLSRKRAVVLARACRPYGVFASCAGLSGDVFAETVGYSAIWSSDGIAIARVGPDPGDSARANLN